MSGLTSSPFVGPEREVHLEALVSVLGKGQTTESLGPGRPEPRLHHAIGSRTEVGGVE